MNEWLNIQHLEYAIDGKIILDTISLSLKKGQGVLITGPSGSGKSVLGKLVAGLLMPTSGTIKINEKDVRRVFIPQQHCFRNLADTKSYYQQRYEIAPGVDFPTVEEYLKNVTGTVIDLTETGFPGVGELLGRRLNTLSNGEGKKVQLAEALLLQPDLIVLDNPFTGLDVSSRNVLVQLLDELIEKQVTVLLISAGYEIPRNISVVAELEGGRLKGVYPSGKYTKTSIASHSVDFTIVKDFLFEKTEEFENVVEMENVFVQIGQKTILENINWKVKKGEKWAVTGPNGAGKSTLLSLITGDNPQVYKNAVRIFDKRTGEGQSIWDIKKRIGFLSPELHIFFRRNMSYTESLVVSVNNTPENKSISSVSCFEAVCSGFNDQVGASQEVTSYQKRIAVAWLKALGIESLARECLEQVSGGQQRLVLLARALVKNPPVLILDEPCQGLDPDQTAMFKEVLNELIAYTDKTVIYISHYTDEIPESIDNFLRIENGRIVAENR